jgi:hypothetical protein
MRIEYKCETPTRSASHVAAEDSVVRLTRQQQQQQEQQQEQQQQLLPQPQPTALNIAGLEQLLIEKLGDHSDLMTVFYAWQVLCWTDDVATLLSGPGHFEMLQQHLQGSGRAPATCTTYLLRLQQALELQQVQQLLHPDVLQSLRSNVDAAIAELRRPPSPAAAAVASSPGRTGRTPAQLPMLQQQQQQQQLGAAAPALTVGQVRELLSGAQSSILHSNQGAASTRWSAAGGGSKDMSVLLAASGQCAFRWAHR